MKAFNAEVEASGLLLQLLSAGAFTRSPSSLIFALDALSFNQHGALGALGAFLVSNLLFNICYEFKNTTKVILL